MSTGDVKTPAVPITAAALKELEKDEEKKRIAAEQKVFNEKVVEMLRER
jgi:hypothetical protein